jgi:hypothetical protein
MEGNNVYFTPLCYNLSEDNGNSKLFVIHVLMCEYYSKKGVPPDHASAKGKRSYHSYSFIELST